MLDALVSGTTDANVLAELAKGRLRAKIPALREALVGRFEDEHALSSGRSSRTSTSSTRRSTVCLARSRSRSALSRHSVICR